MKKPHPAKNRLQNKPTTRQEPTIVPKHQPAVKKNVNLPFYLLFGFAIVLYANSLLNKYASDDRLMITENAFTKKGFSGIKEIMTNDAFVGFFGKQKNLVAGGRYRPLSHVTFAIEYGIFNDFDPFVGHLINVLLYAFACLLLYKVLSMLFPPGKKPFYLSFAFIATALFIAHPLHTEAVANVKGRDEIMSMLGSFGTMYFVLRYIQTSRPVYFLWAALVFLLGLLSKENAITFVTIIPLTLYFFTKTRVKNILISTGCLLGVAFIFVIIRASILGFIMGAKIDYELLNNPFVGTTVAQQFATILLTWGKYLLLLLFPHPLTHDYYPKQIPIINMSDIRAVIPMLIYAAMIIYAIWRFTKKGIIAYSILFFGLTFSIQSNLVFPIGTFMNERFMFLPLLGFCMVLAYLATEKFTMWFKENKAQYITYAFIGIILLGYSVKTIARNPVWHDDYTLFTTDVKVSANSAKVNISAGGQTMELAEKEPDQVKKKNMLETAIKYLHKGVSIHPKYTVGWLLLGKAMIDIDDYPKAREYNDSALRTNPIYKEALNNLLYVAQTDTKNKNYNEAILCYQRLIKYQPTNKNNLVDLAGVYENMKQIDTVIGILNRVLKADSNNVSALNKIGEMYGKYKGDLATSIKYLLKAYSISPSDGTLLENIGVAYGFLKDYKKSIEFFNKALAKNPESSNIYLNLTKSYLALGENIKVAECNAKAAELMKKNK